MQTAKKHRRAISTFKDSNLFQAAVEHDDAHDIPKHKEESSLDYIFNSSIFYLKYKHDAIEYVLSMRFKKGLDSVPKQNTVVSSLEEDPQFIYCLRIDQVQKHVGFDPYTLVMVSPTKATSFSFYFTASTWTITEVCMVLTVCAFVCKIV